MILAVRLNRKRLVVVLEDQIYVYDISNMNLLATLESAPNLNAICALSPTSESNYLAYPVSKKVASPTYELPPHAPPNGGRPAPTSGDVMLYDATKLEQVNIIEAHATPLSHIALNSDGTLLGTASEKGTIIRVFSVPEAQKIFQFRRGSMPSRIYSMSFNTTSTLLCVSSATETVHIFRLSAQSARPSSAKTSSPPTSPSSFTRSSRDRSLSPSSEDQVDSNWLAQNDSVSGSRPQKNPTLMSMLRRTSQNIGGSVAAAVGGYMPSAVTEMWEPQRDFAWVRIPRSNSSSTSVKTVVAMSSNGPQIMVVTSEGNYFVFNIDLETGGEEYLMTMDGWVDLQLTIETIQATLRFLRAEEWKISNARKGKPHRGSQQFSASRLRWTVDVGRLQPRQMLSACYGYVVGHILIPGELSLITGLASEAASLSFGESLVNVG
ncbi:MAG: autophagy protein [Bogoriella megaspora]|nr:MAG: autophagy protein [Bogoriella megaspora]